ncbi:MAG: phage tail protein [Alphaproteobacteria bacterium]|nr:phage tail protein [Alphaproteobacteria bacterium]
MVAYSGNLVLLKIKIGNIYEVVGGMRTTRFLLNNQIIDATHKESGNWRELLSEVGVSSVSITGSGIFTNNASEVMMRDIAFNNKKSKFSITFGNGDEMQGEFIVSTYERAGNVSEEETYNISLESAGKIKYSATNALVTL